MEIPLGKRLRELSGPLLLTGHTGFKGTWMTFLLEQLDVPVVGYSLPAENDSLFDRAERNGAIQETFGDIRDHETLERFIDENRPSTIIHMAAQPLVLKSYDNPRETFDVNVMGTVNLLDVAFKKDFVKAIIVVTTDKVYRNDNSGQAYVENDPLEGKDPYSSSKVGTEAVVAAWQQISRISGGPVVASVRAGNVIGGGDFAKNRIIPDLIRGVISGIPVEIRNPSSTRPWQHVLDPLCGYILALEGILKSKYFSTLNFSPREQSLSVAEIIKIASSSWEEIKIEVAATKSIASKEGNLESTQLNLDSNLAFNLLGWRPIYTQHESVISTINWWKSFLVNNVSAKELCRADTSIFMKNYSLSMHKEINSV